jgi:predicted phosphodiesterase
LEQLYKNGRATQIINPVIPPVKPNRFDSQLIHILHLSDLHIKNEEQARVYKTQLETDLNKKLNVEQLEYMVISGDIANYSTEDEYRAAFILVEDLIKDFKLDPSRIVIVPGNHDLNWDISKKAYPFIDKSDHKSLTEGKFIPAGDVGDLICDEKLYQNRFALFSEYFYKKVYSEEYPIEYVDQALFVKRPNDRILFLGLNSCWQIDHYFKSRASIHMPALTQILDKLQGSKYDGWLKMAVWHHPVTGMETMNTEFIEQLTAHDFQVCLHGHIHEAITTFHKDDDQHGIRIIGAGTFGAPTKKQTPGIPLQYNLLIFDPQKGVITVKTRKKEKPDGAWSADARWVDKEKPKPEYHFKVPHYRGEVNQ